MFYITDDVVDFSTRNKTKEFIKGFFFFYDSRGRTFISD